MVLSLDHLVPHAERRHPAPAEEPEEMEIDGEGDHEEEEEKLRARAERRRIRAEKKRTRLDALEAVKGRVKDEARRAKWECLMKRWCGMPSVFASSPD